MVSICLNVVFARLLKVSICLKKVLDFRNELVGCFSVSCHCEEKNVFGVSRYLNRELLNIFYKYRINIPYPHMVVTDERKTEQRPLEKDSEEEKSSES